jgi:UDP-arabinose 4-epimerase
MTRILVTGGAGYVGSHTCKMLAARGYEIAVFDNLSRGHREFAKWGNFIEGDLANTSLLTDSLLKFKPAAVIHFAAFAYVGESKSNPGLYYSNNVSGTLSLLEAMRLSGVGNLIVSSTCATYGQPDRSPISEDTPRKPINPYGFSKLMMEQMCRDFGEAHGLKYVALRYFNASGCDPDCEIGERHDPEPHLIPRVLMAATGLLDAIDVLGSDYPTPDGTCVRDYVHVSDLAEAHIAAAGYLLHGGSSGAFNLGVGRGVSVREIIRCVERITGHPVPVRLAGRREGDPAILVADGDKARKVLGWSPRHSDIDNIIRTAWQWHCRDHGLVGQ